MEIIANTILTIMGLCLMGAMIKGAQKQAEELIQSINKPSNERPR